MAAPLKREPNKYAKNKDIKADTLLKTLSSLAGILLVLIGLVGIGLEFFKEGGWVKTALAWLFESTTHMIFIPVIILAGWLFNHFISTSAKGEKKKSGDIPMYIMMAIGAYYVYRFVTTGGF